MDARKKTHLPAPPSPPPPPQLEYGECLRNHAASLGAHALDGCGEFAPSASSKPSNPSSITCAACGCHRNFHRRILHRSEDDGDSDEDGGDGGNDEEEMAGSHVLLTLKTGDGTRVDCSRRRRTDNDSGSVKRRRLRSRFSKEQKEGMMELAERLGWRLQRREDGLVEEGCRKVGVERGVFKVWMHNNKQAAFEMKRNHHKACSNGGGVEERSGNGAVVAFSNGPSSSSPPHSCSHG